MPTRGTGTVLVTLVGADVSAVVGAKVLGVEVLDVEVLDVEVLDVEVFEAAAGVVFLTSDVFDWPVFVFGMVM
jgi:hypothetical protein